MAAAKTKSDPNLDEIKPLSGQKSSEKEEVISIRIPGKSSSEKTDTTSKDEPVEGKKMEKEEEVEVEEKPTEEPVEEKKEETDSDNTSNDTKDMKDTKPVSSFRMLDKDDSDSTEEKQEEKTVKTTNDTDSEIDPNEESETTEENTDSVKEWLEDSSMQEEEKQSGGMMKVFLIALSIVILLGIIGGGIYYYQTSVNAPEEDQTIAQNTQTQPEIPTATPMPTEMPVEIELSDYTVSVLNGSGVTGAAGKISTLLEEEGFSEVDAGNADSSEYTDTEVQLRETVPEELFASLEEILGDSYVLTLLDDKLDPDAEYDAVITLGSSEPEEEEETTADSSDTQESDDITPTEAE